MQEKVINRVERHIIKKNHPMYKVIDEYCLKSKNLYNYANYFVRNDFIKNDNYIGYPTSSKILKASEPFKAMGSNSAQMTLRILHKNWLSFFKGVKEYKRFPSKFLGKPNLPKYLKKNGRFTFVLTNMQSKIDSGYLRFSFKPFKKFNNMIKTSVTDKHLQTRFVPTGNEYVLEIVYERSIVYKEVDANRIIGIDLGISRIATIQNNIGQKPITFNGGKIKSINGYYNMKVAKLKSHSKKINGLDWTKRMGAISGKRNRKIDYFMHSVTRYIVNYCKAYNIDTVVIGYNDKWKQKVNLGKVNQEFTSIPFQSFVSKLEYKLEEANIKLVKTEESYTSKASFIDNDQLEKGCHSGKRVQRGLYQSKDGTLINADVNGAGNIIKKVFPNAFDGIKGVHFHPTIINL